jgi:Na+-driven multidrug efflux pump
LAIVDLFGTTVVAAFVVTQRVRGLMNTPGWGFGLASSSLVGQELGTGDEGVAEAYGREIIRFAVAVYLVSGVVVFLLAEPIAIAFIGDPTDPAVPVAVTLMYAACVGIVFRGLSRAATGPLRASGDTRWPFYAQLLGMYAFAIPLAYLGAVTPLGLAGLVLAILAEMVVPAAVNYYRFASGEWKAVSRDYRPDAAPGSD